MSARIVWITGGGTGIGRELALRMAAHGWTVAISGRRQEPLDEVVATGAAGNIHAFAMDVSDLQANRDTVAAITKKLGPIDLAVLNAGVYAPFKMSEFSVEPFERMIRINYLGAVYGLDALLPGMRERRSGHIAFVSSVAGYHGMPLGAPYGATKAALINLAESLRFSFARMGLKVSIINPGFVKTPLTAQNTFPMPFLMDVSDAAARIEKGLDAGRFEIFFPRRLALLLKFFRILPYPVAYPLMKLFFSR